MIALSRIARGGKWIANRWRSAKIAKVNLGKYIILAASGMHLGWAALLISSPSTGDSTPLHVLVEMAGGNYRAAALLLFAAIPALSYPFVAIVGRWSLPAMLIPQQVLLLMSAGAGVQAALAGHYADGVARHWQFILGDQGAIITLAVLYSAAVIEASWTDDRVV